MSSERTKAAKVPISKVDLAEILRYQRFRGRRHERDRIAAYIERLATSQSTSWVAWSTHLFALAARVRKLRVK